MSITNNVSIVISDEPMRNIQTGMQMITDNLPKLNTLTPDQRQTIPEMVDKTVAFVNKSIGYAKQNSLVVPKYLNMEEYTKDVDAINNLFKVAAPINKLAEKLDDTLMMAGSEAYAESLVLYSALKGAIAAGETGLKTVYDDLSTRFPGKNQESRQNRLNTVKTGSQHENSPPQLQIQRLNPFQKQYFW